MSWWELLSIAQEARQEAAFWSRQPRLACPRCGEPLRPGPDSVRYCKFDGWREDQATEDELHN
jgi:hypothetical protein